MSEKSKKPDCEQIDRLEIRIPLPPDKLHPNGRTRNHKYRAMLVRVTRETARLAALAALEGREAPKWRKARLDATWLIPRRRDEDGLHAWLKATRDGLQDAGIVANDSGIVNSPPEQITGQEANGERGVVLVVEPIHSASGARRRTWGSLPVGG